MPAPETSLELTETELNQIVTQAVDAAVDEALAIAAQDYDAREAAASLRAGWRVTAWRGATCAASGAALGALAADAPGLGYGAAAGAAGWIVYELGRRVFGWW